MANEDAKFRIGAQNLTKQAFSEIERSIRSVEGASGKLQATLGGLGAGLSLAGLAAFVKSGINSANALDDLSQRVGVSVESLSAFQFAAKMSDVSAEQLATGFKQLARSAFDAQKGTGEAADAFGALGVSVTGANGGLKSSEQLLLEVADQFADIQDSAGKTALAMRIFGKSGADLVPLLNQGRGGIEALREEAVRLGIVISTETAQAAAKFNDDLDRLATAADKLKFSLAESALPALNRFTQEMLAAQQAAGGLASGLFLMFTTETSNVGRELTKLSGTLDKLKQQRDDMTKPGVGNSVNNFLFSDLEDTDTQIEAVSRRIKFLKDLQRQEALAGGGGDTPGERARMGLAGRGGREAPRLPVTGPKDKRFETALEQLTQEAQKVQELTRFEEVLADVQRGRYGNLTQAQRDRLTALAAEVDLRKEDAQVQKEADTASKKYADDQIARIKKESDELATLTRQYKDLADPLAPLIRKRLEIQKLEGVPGGLTSDEATAALFAIEEQIEAAQGLNRELKETDSFAREIGLTFTSAFEDAVVGGEKFRDVLKGMAQDIARLVIRKTVTEKAGNFISEGIGSVLEGLFRADGGPVSGGSPYIVGERGPELFVPGSSGNIVPNHALGGTGGVVVNNNISMSANSPAAAREAVYAMMPEIERRTRAAVRDERNRTGDRR